MAFIKVSTLDELQPGWVTKADVDGHPYALVNDGGEVRCVDGECPCTGGPLGDGALRDGLVICPWHGWRYDCQTGVCAYDDSVKIGVFPVKIEGQDILIDVTQPLNG